MLAEAGARPAVLERVAALGIESVEPYGFGDPADARALRAEADAAGLAVPSVHGSIPARDPDRFFAALGEVGARVAVLPVPEALEGFSRDAFASADGIARFAEALSRLAEVAERHGARVGYHNHWWEWAALPGGGTAYDLLWEQADPRVLAEVDLYWAQVAGQVPAEVVARLGPRAELVHVKDGTGRPDEAQAPPGSGTIGLDAALAAGAATIAVRIIEADKVDGDPMDYVAAGAAWLRTR